MSTINKSRRVVVTGLGLVTPLGLGVAQNWTNLLACRTGFKKLTSEEYKNLPCRVAALVDQEGVFKAAQAQQIIKKSDLKNMSIANIYALISSHEALSDSGWFVNSSLHEDQEAEKNSRAGVSIATGMAGIAEVAEAALSLHKDPHRGHKHISPYFVPRILPNLSTGLVSIRFKLRGPSQCMTTACAAGAHAIVDACEMIRSGRADLMLCGATEACVHPIALAGFSRMRALATNFNDQPERASRPFDKDRDGFVMSEGAGCLVIECLDTYLKRISNKSIQPKIYAEILGYGVNSDANHITNPSLDGDGAFRCMKLALENSNLKPNQIDYINTHATSTPAGDRAEITAIKRLFNSNEYSYDKEICISSLKGSLGHLLGAAGAVESVFTIKAIQEKVVPASINIDNLDPEFKLNENPHLKIVANQKQALNNDQISVIKNSFGFGGTNASICLSSFKI